MAYKRTRHIVLALTLATSLMGTGGCGGSSSADIRPSDPPESGSTRDDDGEDTSEGVPVVDAARASARDGGRHEDGGAHSGEDSGSAGEAKDAGRDTGNAHRDAGAADDAGAAKDAGDNAGASASAFPSVDGKWAATGPFAVTSKQDGPDLTLYYPTDLGRGGLKHPVVVWGNGTGATPAAYAGLLNHWASHGFIVAAANTTQAGSGKEMLAGADWLVAENGRSQSPFFGKVDVSNVAATGHSQGGGGAIAAGADSMVTTTMPIQPGPQGQISALHGPMFIVGGGSDTIVVPTLLVEPRYKQATQIEAVYGLLKNATHFEVVGDGGHMRGYLTAWLRSQLMDDAMATAEFHGACGLCGDPDWTVQRNFR